MRTLDPSETRPEPNLDAQREAKEAIKKPKKAKGKQERAKERQVRPREGQSESTDGQRRRPDAFGSWHGLRPDGMGGLPESSAKADKKQAMGKESKKKAAVNPKHA